MTRQFDLTNSMHAISLNIFYEIKNCAFFKKTPLKQGNILILSIIQKQSIEDIIEKLWIILTGPFTVRHPVELQHLWNHSFHASILIPGQHKVCGIHGTRLWAMTYARRWRFLSCTLKNTLNHLENACFNFSPFKIRILGLKLLYVIMTVHLFQVCWLVVHNSKVLLINI